MSWCYSAYHGYGQSYLHIVVESSSNLTCKHSHQTSLLSSIWYALTRWCHICRNCFQIVESLAILGRHSLTDQACVNFHYFHYCVSMFVVNSIWFLGWFLPFLWVYGCGTDTVVADMIYSVSFLFFLIYSFPSYSINALNGCMPIYTCLCLCIPNCL